MMEYFKYIDMRKLGEDQTTSGMHRNTYCEGYYFVFNKGSKEQGNTSCFSVKG